MLSLLKHFWEELEPVNLVIFLSSRGSMKRSARRIWEQGDSIFRARWLASLAEFFFSLVGSRLAGGAQKQALTCTCSCFSSLLRIGPLQKREQSSHNVNVLWFHDGHIDGIPMSSFFLLRNTPGENREFYWQACVMQSGFEPRTGKNWFYLALESHLWPQSSSPQVSWEILMFPNSTFSTVDSLVISPLVDR